MTRVSDTAHRAVLLGLVLTLTKCGDDPTAAPPGHYVEGCLTQPGGC